MDGIAHPVPIEEHMTVLPVTASVDSTLAEAARLMRENGIHHLPVVEDGSLTGLVSERDLLYLQALDGVDPNTTEVRHAMTVDVYSVSPETPLGEVIRTMADHSYGSVVIADGATVLGILTATDAMHLLATLLGADHRDLAPSEVRARILREHARLRAMLDKTEAAARGVLRGEEEHAPILRQWARDLHAFLRAHLRMEDELLVPAMLETPGFGKERADAVEAEHAEQREVFRQVLGTLHRKTPAKDLATRLLELAKSLREDMDREEKDFVNDKLLRDDTMPADYFGG